MQTKNYPRARPITEQARVKLPNNYKLWRISIELEIEAKNKDCAKFLLSKALKECPGDGLLWSYYIDLEPKATRKKAIYTALST